MRTLNPDPLVVCVRVCVSSGDVEQVEGAAKITVRIFKNITLVHEAGMVLLEVSESNGNTAHHVLCVCV